MLAPKQESDDGKAVAIHYKNSIPILYTHFVHQNTYAHTMWHSQFVCA